MSPEEFRKQLDIASAHVATWPVWKQNIIRDSLSPTVPVPRTPVDNSRAAEQEKKQERDRCLKIVHDMFKEDVSVWVGLMISDAIRRIESGV